ncbi:Uncharacterised protein [Porphyromonas macacae]|uniref:Uncharacterized protein n=1 Tax=Porphyromonas macacae TaxID=28115 RepID=A0A379DHE4_9PORP|nr:Uncharacterised protein [Porphyromonas macacae]
MRFLLPIHFRTEGYSLYMSNGWEELKKQAQNVESLRLKKLKSGPT